MPRELYVLLWSDEDGPQCAVYEAREDAERDAHLVGGRVEARAIHLSETLRSGRFIRPQG